MGAVISRCMIGSAGAKASGAGTERVEGVQVDTAGGQIETSSLRSGVRRLALAVLPDGVVRLVRKARGVPLPPPAVGKVRFGDLRRLEPVSRNYGFGRGRPIDRYYIEGFLERNAADIRGRTLEIGDAYYTGVFGRGVTQADVLHVTEGAPGATFIDDLSRGETLPDGAFDCLVLTQTLHLIYDMQAAVRTIHRILKPGGVVLATVPGITQISDATWNDSWYWALSALSAERLFAEVFGKDAVEVKVYGNVLSATSFLQGLADSELTPAELDHFDPEYPVIIAVRAKKAGG